MSRKNKVVYKAFKDQRDHVLLRPDMYIGSVKNTMTEFYKAVRVENDGLRIFQTTDLINPGLHRIFIEILSNAIDNFLRSKDGDTPCKKIKINITEEGEITIWNDGETIAVEINEHTGLYNPEMIFGNLLTGSNFDDEDVRETSGRNGVGGKATNIYSKSFTINTFDLHTGKKYVQTWENNMGTKGNAKITTPKLKNGYTEVIFTPDYEKFGVEKLSEDMIGLFLKNIIDTAMITGVDVFFNDIKIPIKTLVDYSLLYESEFQPSYITLETDDTRAVLTENTTKTFKAISFVNGIETYDGGCHVDTWTEALLRPILEKLNKGIKTGNKVLTIKDIKPYFRLFLISKLDRPAFTNQSKTKLSSPQVSKPEVLTKQINAVMKWPVIQTIKEELESKDLLALKKTEKKKGYRKIKNLDPANLAGSKRSDECSLIFCEGESASTFAMAGISTGVYGKSGRDFMGIYEGRGVCVASDTPIVLYDGTKKIADQIEVGDVLIGDDGCKRNVLSLMSGVDEMFRISSNNKSYVVSSSHTLSLTISGHGSIVWNKIEKSWKLYYMNKETYKFCIKKSKVRNGINSKEEAYREVISFRDTLPDDKIDIKLDTYLSLPNKIKKHFTEYNCSGVDWPYNKVRTEPYVFGLWIGTGEYGLKCIPSNYLVNDRKTRLQLLAGIIDSDKKNPDLFEFSQYSYNRLLLDDVVYLVRSLGFDVRIINLGDIETIKISGNLKDIPVRVHRKSIFYPKSCINVEYVGRGSYSGWEVDGNSRYCLYDFTATHNCMNVRGKKGETIAGNKEICDIIQAFNFKTGVDYTEDRNYKTLSYGRFIILTDSDYDGFHIGSLLVNFIHYLFPSLLQRDVPFVTYMRTPIIRIYYPIPRSTKHSSVEFYTLEDFRKYKERYPEKKGEIKYFKGLGSNTKTEAVEIFGKKMIEFVKDDKADETLDMLFNSKRANDRKEWIGNYIPSESREIVSKDPIQRLPISDFLNNEVILFSIDDCGRSIPNIVDGLKEGARKVLYTAKTKKLLFGNKPIKVAQLAGATSELSGYHHGEQCLHGTITGMAQDYVGSNNIPLLFRGGAFGTRVKNGKDAASGRYTFTKLDMITSLLFKQEDDPLLTYILEEGESIEPEFYVPILPMVLVNGVGTAIGTGWSSSIPCYNPKDLVSCIRAWLYNDHNIIDDEKSDDSIKVCVFPEIFPWYRGFTGIIEKGEKKDRFVTSGVLTKKGTYYLVTELPIGMSTAEFKDFLEDLLEEKSIKEYKNYSNDTKIDFRIYETTDGLKCSLESLKLTTSLSTSNMVLFTEKRVIKKHDDVESILEDFCNVRYDFYVKRRENILKDLRFKLKILQNKSKFLKDVMSKEIIIDNTDEKVLLKTMESRGYDGYNDEKNKDDDEDDGGLLKKYKYLVGMNIRSFTKQKQSQLHKDIEKIVGEIREIEKITPSQMWSADLDVFESAYEDYSKYLEEQN